MIRRTIPKTKPVAIPGRCAEDGGMYRYRFSGFLKSVMSNLLLVIDNVIHLNQSFMEHANYDIFICDFVQMKTN